jgi:pilus assembly protein CpaE
VLRIIEISPDGLRNGELRTALAGVLNVRVVHGFSSYPTPDDLLSSIRIYKPDVLFLWVNEFSQVEVLVARLDALMPGFPVIAVGADLAPNVTRKLMHLGVREYLTVPIKQAELVGVIGATEQYLKQHPQPVSHLADLYTFLPAKPGVGASTITVSAACALAHDLGARTLLLDCDIDAGTIKFLLKLEKTASLPDAVQYASKLDDDLLAQMVGKWEQLDVLHAGQLGPPPSIDLRGLQRVLEVARSQYEVICADLASSLNSLSMTLMGESSRVFVVTTPELIPLHFARERIRYLRELGIGDRVKLLLNRKSSGKPSMGDDEAAGIVGIPVDYSFPNDYTGVQSSIVAASPVSSRSDLGESILALSRSLTLHPVSKAPTLQRKFLEFFRIGASQNRPANVA